MSLIKSFSSNKIVSCATAVPCFASRGFLSACIAFLLFSLGFFVPNAYAEVRSSDLVCGTSVEERGLSAGQCPNIDANFACIIDDEGMVYFERGSMDSAQIASVTKIMTAIVALDAVNEGLVSLDTTIAVTEEAAYIGESSAGLQEGDLMDLQTALTALLVPSGNDAAVAISQAIGQVFIDQGISSESDPEAAFVEQMNAKAAELGCTNSVFENPHGLDYDEYEGSLHSCAMDVCMISNYAMDNDVFREAVALGDTSIEVRRNGAPESIELTATDMFPQIYDYAIGIKTGFTELAGSCFAGASNNGEKELYVAVLYSSDNDQRFYDAMTLCDWVYENEQDYTLANSQQTIEYQGQTVPLAAEVSHGGWIDKTVPACLANPDESVRIFSLNGNVTQTVEYKELTNNVHAGEVVGTITFKQRDVEIAKTDLIACEDLKAPNFFQSIKIWFTRTFSSGQKQASSVLYNETPLVIDKSQPGM